jgi:hypothetical protein
VTTAIRASGVSVVLIRPANVHLFLDCQVSSTNSAFAVC